MPASSTTNPLAERLPGAPARPRPGRMLFVTAAWGACFVAIEWGLRDAPVLWFAALRGLVAGAALLLLAAVQRRPGPSGFRAWGQITLLGLVNGTLAFAAMFAAVAGLATGTAAVLANAQPLLIVLPAWWLYGESLSQRTAVALLVGFTGLVLVAVPGGGGDGAVLSLTAAAAITAGTLLSRRLGGLDVIVTTGWHFVIGGVAGAVLAAVVEGAPVIAWTPRFVAVLGFLSLVGTAAAFVVWFTEVQRARLDLLSAWTFLAPVVGVALAALLLRERPDGWTAVGLFTVLVALWVILRPSPSPVRPVRRSPGHTDAHSEMENP